MSLSPATAQLIQQATATLFDLLKWDISPRLAATRVGQNVVNQWLRAGWVNDDGLHLHLTDRGLRILFGDGDWETARQLREEIADLKNQLGLTADPDERAELRDALRDLRRELDEQIQQAHRHFS